VTVDVVLLSASHDPGDERAMRAFLPLVRQTGGCAFAPATADDLKRLLQAEQFVDLRLRAPAQRIIRDGEAEALKKWLAFSANVPVALPFRQSDPLRALQLAAFQTAPPRSFCDARILKEMQICIDNGFMAYAAVDSILDWRVFLPAPLSGAAHGRVFWPIAVSFRPDYPYVAPTFRFLALPPLPNVSALGRVRNNVIETYHPRFHIARILQSIQALFQAPDPLIPYSQDSAADGCPWNPEDYGELIAAGCANVWVPLPDLDYLPFVCGGILTGGPPLPPRTKAADLSPRSYSMISWKKLGEVVTVGGGIIAPEEQRYFQGN
jgi:ubiquitin-protein ligase